MKTKYILTTAAALALLWACQNDDTDSLTERQKQALLETDVMGAYQNEKGVFVFDDDVHQAFYSVDDRTMRLQSDDMTEILNLSLDSRPMTGIKTTGTVETSGIDGLKEGSFGCTVLKTGGDRLWLWDDDHNTGYIFFWGN